MHYANNITYINAYWPKTKEQLKATIRQVRAPTIFWTLSCADFHWPEFHMLFYNNQNQDFRANVINNPHILDWFFMQRTEQFVKWWLYNSLSAQWHWYRYEFAVQRGSIHCHGVAKLANDPDLCGLTKITLKGFLALKAKKNTTSDFLNINQIDGDIAKGLEAERKVCQYVDFLMSTCNPCDPEEDGWVKPLVHPSKIPYLDISDSEWDQDYENLLNSVQRHTHCSSAYCLWQKNGRQYCRFSHPIDPCEQTHIEFEQVNTKDGFRAKVVTARMIHVSIITSVYSYKAGGKIVTLM